MTIQRARDGNVSVYQVDLDGPTDRSMSCAVVESIADLTDQDPMHLESLWESVDPEALDSFVTHADESSTPCQLAFQYQGYTVEIVENNRIRLIPTEATLAAANV